MNKPLFSIITPTYNRYTSGYLEANISSVQNQEAGEFTYEHIIIDDGSSDQTGTFVKNLAKSDEQIKYHYQKNTGVVRATQKGIKLASGEYIIILDDDDLLTANSLKLRAEYLMKNKVIDWFYGHAEWIDDFGLPTRPKFRSKYYSDHLYERMLVNNLVHSGTPTVKNGVLKEIAWPDWLERSQDYFLWLELMRPERKLKVGFINRVLTNYRYHSQSYTSAIDNDFDKEEKKRKKEELNFKIRSLHPDSFYYLAKEAHIWLQEAHKTSDYWKEQNRYLNNELKYSQDLIKTYKSSRIIGRIIKLGNLIRRYRPRIAQINRRVLFKLVRISRRLILRKAVHQVTITQDEWDKSRPLVSVVTPFYNRSDTMPDTVRSVLNQTFQNFEYIVVDDGSTLEESKAYIGKLKHPKVKVIKQTNIGVAGARNKGIEKAVGKYVICLDDDDVLEPTYLEKAVAILETDPSVSIVTFDTKMFGAKDHLYLYRTFDPFRMVKENMVITAAVFKRDAWENVGGYKDNIGYEDWEFWTNLTKNGFFAKHVSEAIFNYRTAENSRYVDDLAKHHDNAKHINKLHRDFKRKVRKHVFKMTLTKRQYDTKSVLKNINQAGAYKKLPLGKPNVLIAVPWMTFGGAETLIINFTNEIKDQFNLSFVTGLKAEHEWEHKFKEITPFIYHLANLFDKPSLYLEFISNYISTRKIDVLHIIHNGYMFKLLPELKKRHPNLKVVTTMFNDYAPYFRQSVHHESLIDIFSTDNQQVANRYEKMLPKSSDIDVIPNGIDVSHEFYPGKFNRLQERENLKITNDELSVFFIGRLSEEKNPDVFLDVAESVQASDHSKRFKFFIVGDGPKRRFVEHNIDDRRLENLVYLGYQKDVSRYLSAADIFVLPSSVEGFPLSILEAMAMKVTVIASKVGAIPDIIEDGKSGFIVHPGSAEEIVDIIMKLSERPDLLESIKNNARDEVKDEYSNDKLGSRYSKLYRKVLK